MKKPGSHFYLEKERNKDLLHAFKELYISSDRINTEFYTRLSLCPSRRFWVSEERAGIVLSRIRHGDPLDHMTPGKRRMFHDLYQIYLTIKNSDPGLSYSEAVSLAVSHPAPSFYLTPKSIKEIIYRIKRQWYEKQQRYKKS